MKPRLVLVACLSVAGLPPAGCSQAPERSHAAAPRESPQPGAAPTSGPEPAASAPPAVARRESVENDLMDFSYDYPAQAAAIPSLAALLDAEIVRQKQKLLPQAKAMRQEARDGGFPFHPLGYWAEWNVVTDLPGWLSLSAEISTFEGGAHPNHHYDTILWDKQENRRRRPVSLFVSAGALDAAIRKDFCRALDSQRKERRGEDWKLGGGIAEFDACIAPLENTLILGSSNGKAFDRLGVLIAPYQAGPYAEGGYEVTLPVTPAVMDAVRDEFRPAFAIRR